MIIKTTEEKEPIIAKILTVLGFVCFGGAALCGLAAVVTLNLSVLVIAVAIGISGVLYIALSEIVIYLSAITLLLRKLTQGGSGEPPLPPPV